MILVVGLGNPGLAYENTRHNAGFMLIDSLELKEHHLNSSFKGELYKKNGVLFLKPTTFMNASGESVKAVRDYYKCERVIVIHDDIDLDLGTLRFKKAGGSAGHNGLKSIDAFIGNDYERIRIGVGKDADVSAHVLGRFSELENKILGDILAKAKEGLKELIKTDDIKAVGAKYSIKA